MEDPEDDGDSHHHAAASIYRRQNREPLLVRFLPGMDMDHGWMAIEDLLPTLGFYYINLLSLYIETHAACMLTRHPRQKSQNCT